MPRDGRHTVPPFRLAVIIERPVHVADTHRNSVKGSRLRPVGAFSDQRTHNFGPRIGPPAEDRIGRERHTPERIAAALLQLESGIPAVELCRRLGVHENAMSAWKKKYGSLGTPEIRQLRQLREENIRLRKLVAGLALEKTMLQDVVLKKW